MLTIYGDSISGNCQKVRFTADRLRIPYRWIETSVLRGETRVAEFLALNPAGQVPLIVLPDGRPLAQSNAIMLHLAEGSDLVPRDPYDRAVMLQWMFGEQYSHEPVVAVRRYFVSEALTLADIALVAYTRLAHEGGFDLAQWPGVSDWVRRVEGALGLPDARQAARS